MASRICCRLIIYEKRTKQLVISASEMGPGVSLYQPGVRVEEREMIIATSHVIPTMLPSLPTTGNLEQ